MPDVHRYWASDVAQKLHYYWQNVAIDDSQRQILMCSGPSGTAGCTPHTTVCRQWPSFCSHHRPLHMSGMVHHGTSRRHLCCHHSMPAFLDFLKILCIPCTVTISHFWTFWLYTVQVCQMLVSVFSATEMLQEIVLCKFTLTKTLYLLTYLQ